MKWLMLILIIFSAFLACEQVVVPDVVFIESEPPPEEPPPVEPPPEDPPPEEPAWQPEAWHIYILDAADVILFDYEAANLTDYRYMLQAVKMKISMHNRDFSDPWHWAAGGVS